MADEKQQFLGDMKFSTKHVHFLANQQRRHQTPESHYLHIKERLFCHQTRWLVYHDQAERTGNDTTTCDFSQGFLRIRCAVMSW